MKKKTKSKHIKPKSFQSTRFTVEQDDELLPFLLTHINKSRNAVKSILTRGQVEVNNTPTTKHNYKLTSGDVVSIQSNESLMKEKALIGLTVVYEDDDIIVIDKEEGLLSVATDKGNEPTAHNQLMGYVKRDHPKNRVFIVHRLDKDTSGIMLFAKKESVKRALQDSWKESVKERIYTALVEGKVKKENGTITSWLTESKTFKVYSSPHDNGGKKAITHYKVTRQNNDYSLLEVSLETGRKNQIRVHMQSIGHPIVGDKKYGATSNPLKRLGLHATTLVFNHPTTGKKMVFKSKIPRSFIKKTQVSK
ncbi:RluA family pseudouridine synthase [Vagococcus luciliae]|uniref:Pseudouridine synthase n=1 Tax=Vagococcus luciliae TaxID=2920380 RepID=A0ABY5P2B6_9ENTE|nr:RluA family pseudouridine synthase [Vagococcus luciliae]UUV99801.1 Ribosomal large subunit pseudouridine synthase D [Vagococcus luciliae]